RGPRSAVEDDGDPDPPVRADDADRGVIELATQDVLAVELARHEGGLEALEGSAAPHVLAADPPAVTVERVAELIVGRVEEVALFGHRAAVLLRVAREPGREPEVGAIASLTIVVGQGEHLATAT